MSDLTIEDYRRSNAELTALGIDREARIEELQAEIERLREALHQIAEWPFDYGNLVAVKAFAADAPFFAQRDAKIRDVEAEAAREPMMPTGAGDTPAHVSDVAAVPERP